MGETDNKYVGSDQNNYERQVKQGEDTVCVGEGGVLLDRVVRKNCLISLPLSSGLKKVRTNALWMSERAVVHAEGIVSPKR